MWEYLYPMQCSYMDIYRRTHRTYAKFLLIIVCKIMEVFRCASISWFQVVSESVIHAFRLAHLRVFQSYFFKNPFNNVDKFMQLIWHIQKIEQNSTRPVSDWPTYLQGNALIRLGSDKKIQTPKSKPMKRKLFFQRHFAFFVSDHVRSRSACSEG